MAMKAVLLGFGGSGAQILTFVKEIIVWKNGKAPETVKFLLFDTIEEWEAGKTVQIAGGRDTEKLAASKDAAANLDSTAEYFHLRDGSPTLNEYVRGANRLPATIASWLHVK